MSNESNKRMISSGSVPVVPLRMPLSRLSPKMLGDLGYLLHDPYEAPLLFVNAGVHLSWDSSWQASLRHSMQQAHGLSRSGSVVILGA